VSQHAGPPRAADEPAVPETSFAERARTLLHQASTGTLATLSRRHPGHPFASIMPYALDGDGRPLFLISSMAMHTQNFGGDPRASLLVTQPGATGDPLASGRVTLMGRAQRLTGDDVAAARTGYLAAHPNAAYWVDFDDFSFWRLEVEDVYFVGGFAAMGWVEAGDYGAARPDPLAEVAESIMEHMNADHVDALLAYARFFAKEKADEAHMVAVDRLGFKLSLKDAERRWSIRVAFPREVTTAADSRVVLIEMARAARAA
jgi:heme oxygenase (biliverdin-IX-beta and delta-forming)